MTRLIRGYALLLWAMGSMVAFGAEGLRTMPASAQSQGMIGGKVALTNDPSVVRLNPASMLDVTGRQLQISPSVLLGQTDYSGVAGTDKMEEKFRYVGAINFVWPLKDSRSALGLGLNAPFGLAANWPRSGAFQGLIPYEEELIYAALNPAFAYRINDRISVGTGLEIVYSRLDLKQIYPWALATGVPGTPLGKTDIEGDGWGLGAYAGINVMIADGHRLSVVGRLPVRIDYKGDFGIDNIPGPLTGTFSPSSDFSSDIEFPGSIAIAYGIDLSDQLRVGFEFEWIQNSSHDDVPLLVGANQGLFPTDRIVLDWDDSFTLGAGIEWDMSDRLTLRAGYIYGDSPISDKTFTPAIPASDRHMVSVGATYKVSESQALSLAYVSGFYADRTVPANQVPAFNGTYEAHWDVLTLSYTLTW